MPAFARPSSLGIRGEDGYGSGAFLAGRAGHFHRGVDYITRVGQFITAPSAGEQIRIGFPYGDDLSYRLIEIISEWWTVRLYYVQPLMGDGTVFSQGSAVGTSQDLSRRYPVDDDHPGGITQHVHCEVVLSPRFALPAGWVRGRDYEMLADAGGDRHLYASPESLAGLA